MKQYNCPDCTHTEDTCENCSRYQMYHRTNLNEYNIQWPYQPTITFERKLLQISHLLVKIAPIIHLMVEAVFVGVLLDNKLSIEV